MLVRHPAADVQVGLALVAAEVQHFEGAEVLSGAFFSRCTPISRLRVVWMANLPRSVAIHLRPSFSATAAVVPRTTEEVGDEIAFVAAGFDDALKRASGF